MLQQEPDALLIWGSPGCDMTRQAADYALKRAAGMVGSVRCFVIEGNDPLRCPQDAPGFDMGAAVIIFDDIGKHWRRYRHQVEVGAAVGLTPGERLCELIGYFHRETRACVVIATVPSGQDDTWPKMRRDPDMSAVLQLLKPHIRIVRVDGEEAERDYLAAACRARNITSSETALDALVEANVVEVRGGFIDCSVVDGPQVE